MARPIPWLSHRHTCCRRKLSCRVCTASVPQLVFQHLAMTHKDVKRLQSHGGRSWVIGDDERWGPEWPLCTNIVWCSEQGRCHPAHDCRKRWARWPVVGYSRGGRWSVVNSRVRFTHPHSGGWLGHIWNLTLQGRGQVEGKWANKSTSPEIVIPEPFPPQRSRESLCSQSPVCEGQTWL
jgi:hypothetical protein